MFSIRGPSALSRRQQDPRWEVTTGGVEGLPDVGRGWPPVCPQGAGGLGAAVPLLAVLSGSLLSSSWALAPTGLTVGVVRTNFSS